MAELKYVTFLHEQIIRRMSSNERIKFENRKQELQNEARKRGINLTKLTKKI